MNIVLTYPSALDYWLTCKNTGPLSHCNMRPSNIAAKKSNTNTFESSITVPDPFSRRQIIDDLEGLGLKRPFHIAVSDRSSRDHGKDFACHLLPKELPSGSFVKLSESIYIICPELCYILAAKDMLVAEAAVTACDLCAIYARKESEKFGQISRAPVTTVKKISAYLKVSKGIPGLYKARIAISYALDRSNSPIESKLAVIAVLPCMHGGYGLPHPKLNAYISLSVSGVSILKRKQCCCDMLWTEQRVVAEYDSDLAHNSVNQMRYDKRRSTALLASDYLVIHITRDSFRNFNTVEDLFQLIRKSLHMRSNKPKLEKYKDVRYEVIKRFFLTFGVF